MSLSTLVLRLTHSGLDKFGNPFTGSILIPDLETGLEYQGRKSAVYVPHEGSIIIPVVNRVAFSMYSGAIKQFVEDGYLIAESMVDINGSLTSFDTLVDLEPSPSGSYLNPSIQVNSKGIITSAAERSPVLLSLVSTNSINITSSDIYTIPTNFNGMVVKVGIHYVVDLGIWYGSTNTTAFPFISLSVTLNGSTSTSTRYSVSGTDINNDTIRYTSHFMFSEDATVGVDGFNVSIQMSGCTGYVNQQSQITIYST
jgi:hypothetical protein